jgi:PKHD-type hydroxylase
MFLAIAGVLEPDELETARALLAEARFEDGRKTAGAAAAKVKHNMQADAGDPRTRDAKRMVAAAVQRHPLFRSAVRPSRLSPLLLSRSRAGDGYGAHMDDAVMRIGGDDLLRADVSFTVFISPPEAYEGGALVIEGADGERAYKLPAGAAIVYPSTTLHRVETVTSGERLVAAGWAQSLIRAPEKRELLYDLERALSDAEAAGAVNAALTMRKSISNLLRMWAEI